MTKNDQDQTPSQDEPAPKGTGNENPQDATKCAFCGETHPVIYRVLRLTPRGLANICRDCLVIHAEEYLLDNTRPFNPWSRKS